MWPDAILRLTQQRNSKCAINFVKISENQLRNSEHATNFVKISKTNKGTAYMQQIL
jgi:hypothetical protein